MDQNAINRACAKEIYIGINKAEQQLRTKSDAALIIPIAIFIKRITYLYLPLHATYNQKS